MLGPRVRLTSGHLPQGDQPKNWAGDCPKDQRAPTQELDRPPFFFFNTALKDTLSEVGSEGSDGVGSEISALTSTLTCPCSLVTSWVISISAPLVSFLSPLLFLCSALVTVPGLFLCVFRRDFFRLWYGTSHDKTRYHRLLDVPFSVLLCRRVLHQFSPPAGRDQLEEKTSDVIWFHVSRSRPSARKPCWRKHPKYHLASVLCRRMPRVCPFSCVTCFEFFLPST